MIRRFATLLMWILVLEAAGYAQGTSSPPQSQQPVAQQPATGPENPEGESSSTQRRVKVRDYRKWTFNVGGGANLASGTTRTFVKGGGGVAAAGAARNFNKYFGLRLDFMWADLPLRTSALQLAQAPGGSDHVYALTLDPIINIPVTSKYSGYFVIGPGFYRRSGNLDSSTAVRGSPCNDFWTWWGTCFNGSVPLTGNFLAEKQNEFGFNFGAGVAHKVRGNLEVYGEFRYLHGKRNNTTTDVRPITIGVRW